MKKRQFLRRALASLCCAAMLLPCVPASLASDTTVFTEGFETYREKPLTAEPYWTSNGNNTTEVPTVSSEQAHSGTQSLMLRDTKTATKDGSVQLVTPSGALRCDQPAGTEFLLNVWYKTDGNGSFKVRLTADNVHQDVDTFAGEGWQQLSAINTTTKDNGTLRVWLISSAANTGTVWFDDVTISVLTEELALQYLDEKLSITGTPNLEPVLTSKALGLTGADAALIKAYTQTLCSARADKGRALTRDEVQTCIDQINSGDFDVFSDDFEHYPEGSLLSAERWSSNGNSKTDYPTITTQQAYSGSKSLMLHDTQTVTSAGSVQLVSPTGAAIHSEPAGTEFILTTRFKTQGSGTFLLRLTAGSVHSDVNSYPTDEWNTLSAINTVSADKESLRVWLVSSAANVGTIWFDDVRIQKLTAPLAVDYIEEKLKVDSPNAAYIMKALASKALGLDQVDEKRSAEYTAELKAARQAKGTALTADDLQQCVTSVNLVRYARTLEGNTLSVGNTGEIPVPVQSLPSGVTAQWVEVSPAGNAVSITNGKAEVATIPTAGEEAYTLTLRLSTATKSADVPYTVRLVNSAGYDEEQLANAKALLAEGNVIGVTQPGAIALPAAEGVTTQWLTIKSDPNSRLSLSGGGLSVRSVPSGWNNDEAVVTLKLTKSGFETTLDYTIIIYDNTYHTLVHLPNAGFEAVQDGLPTGWVAAQTFSPSTWIEPADTIARTGTKSVRVMDDSTGLSMGVRHERTAIPAKIGYDYVASAWVLGTADAATADRAGAAAYVVFNTSETKQAKAYSGAVKTISPNTWTQVTMRGRATTSFVNAMGYSYQATVSDMYFDDFLLWEITPAGILAEIDEALLSGDAKTLYDRLGSGTLNVTGLASGNQARYLTDLQRARNTAGKPLDAAQLAAEIKTINANVTAENKAAVAAVKAMIPTKLTVSTPGEILPPAIGDTGVTLSWSALVENQNGRIHLDGGRAIADTLPASGSMNDSATLTLSIKKGAASATVNVLVVMKAMSADMSAMVSAARTLDVKNFLNGQNASFVTANINTPPTSLNGGISISWQALDSATLQPSAALTAQGAVTRPAYGEPDAAVTLRATLTKGTESFIRDLYLIVPALSADDARTVITNNTNFEAAAPADKFTAPTGWNKRLKWADGANEILTSYANIDTETAFTGKQSLRITADGKMASVQNEAVFTVQEGFAYTLETMVYTGNSAATPSITMKFWNIDGTLMSSATQTYAAAPGGCGVWKNLRVSAVAPVGAVQVTAELDAGTKAAAVWFDDVRLREYPIAANGSFDSGTAGWATQGTVSNGKLTLTAGQSAESMIRGADRGVAYWLSLTADGGKAALRFVDRDGNVLAKYAKELTSGKNTFYAYAPEKTAGVQAVLTGAMTADDVTITRAPSGTAVADGDFTFSAGADMGTPWDLTNATIAANTGKAGAGLTVKAGGKAMSNIIPTLDGKCYTFTADVKGEGTMSIGLYNIGTSGSLQKVWTVSSAGNDWNTLSYTIDAIPQGGSARDFYEHAYIRVTLTGEAVFDNVTVRSVSKTVSNASMEALNDAVTGTFPYGWTPFGQVAAYVANQPGQATEGSSGLAVELFGLGEGGVRSSMVSDVMGGKAYEATINAKGSGGTLSIEFWDKDFNKLGGETVTINSTNWKKYSVTGTAPSGAVYATLSVGDEGSGLVYVDEASLLPVVRSIGTNLQLFLDDWLIANSQNIKRTFHPGEKMEPMIERRWYGSQFWNEDKQIYESFNIGSPNYAMYYQTSKDGVNWDGGIKCSCPGLEEPDSMSGPSVFYDRDKKVYTAVFYDRGSEWYVLCTSTDAVHWTIVDHVLHGWDVIMVAYDEVNDEYVCVYKLTQANGVTGAQEEKRVHSTATSKDLIHWTEGVRMFSIGAQEDAGDDFVRIDSYGVNIDALGDSYIGFNERFSLDDADGYGGLMDSNLLFSRDLSEEWQRIYDENGDPVVVIPRGPAGNWDDAQAYPRFPVRVGDETWWYYHGWSGDHGTVGVPKVPMVSAIKWRLNGYASLDFAQNGTMTTQQFTLMGDKLHLNAKGDLTIELLDAKGAVVATGSFSGDSVDAVILWDKSVTDQLGKAVSLRFTGSSAELYSLQIGGSVFNDVSTDDWHHRAVHYAVDNGIMSGYGSGKFGPDDTLSRAMVVQMLYNKVGQPKITGKHAFNDVPADQWFNNAVTWGTKNGVMGGYGNGTFGPNDNVTIEQVAVILWNYAGNPDFKETPAGVGAYSGWAANALGWAFENGILHNVPFKNATQSATRAQAAQMLMNFFRL